MFRKYCKCTGVMAYSLRRLAGLVSVSLLDSVTVVTHVTPQYDNLCTPSTIRTRTHSRKVGDPKTDIIPRVDLERFAFDLHLVLATLRIWKACVGGDDTTSTSITGLSVNASSGRVFSCRTGLVIFYLSLRFPCLVFADNFPSR